MALDNPSKVPTAKEMLRHDLGRRKTSLFLHGTTQAGIIDAASPAGTGIYIGKIENAGSCAITVSSPERVNAGDLLRVQPHSGGEGVMAAAVKCEKTEGVLTITLDAEVACAPGDSLYCVGREARDKKAVTKLTAAPSGTTNGIRTSMRCFENTGPRKSSTKTVTGGFLSR